MKKVNDTPKKPAGRRAGSADTKVQILSAAQTVFSESGLDQTTIRQIAAKAEVDPALVIHYFKTKKQLFIESIAPILHRRQITLLSTALAETPPELRGRKLAEALIAFMTDEEVRPHLLSVVRSITSDEYAVTIMKGLIERVFTSEVEKYIQKPNQKLTSEFIGTQFMGLVVGRYIVKIEPLASTSPEALVEYLAPSLQAHFDT